MGAGRPLKYKTVEELDKKIEEYFKYCDGEMLKDDEGKPVLNKYDEPIMINTKPYTMTGLALYLGFNSRHSLLNYQDKEEFMHSVTRAKARVEEYAEKRLYDKDGCNGAKFNLSNNFGWREKTETEISGETTVNNKIDLGKFTTDELKNMLKND